MLSFDEYITQIASSLEVPTLDNLDLLTAFYLGFKATSADPILLKGLEENVHSLYTKKRGIKFIDRLLVTSGSNSLTPASKAALLGQDDPFLYIKAVNDVAGKKEATPLIEPYRYQLADSAFHEKFLAYEAKAHHDIVGALITRLQPVIDTMRREVRVIQSSKKNTLKNLYQAESVGKTFISLDLRQANWSALRYWDSKLPSWQDFLETCLPDSALKPLFKASKNFRQVTLGVALKKYNAIKMVESTQVMLVKRAAQPVIKRLGNPFSESNDEIIFEWRQPLGAPLEKWLLNIVTDPLFRITRFTVKERTFDECFVVNYHEYGNPSRDYSLLRVASAEKVEARLAK